VKCDFLNEDEIETALVERDGVDRETAQMAARLANGSYSTARRLCRDNIGDERKDAVEFLRLVLGKYKDSLMDAIEAMSAAGDKQGFRQWLRILQSWLRDAMVIRQGAVVYLADEEKHDIEKFNRNFANADLISAIRSVDAAIAHLDKNVYLPLILINLAVNLRSDISEKK